MDSTETQETQQPIDHASPGREISGHGGDDGEAGVREDDLEEAMSEASFATAASQGYRTEDDEVTPSMCRWFNWDGRMRS